MKTGLVLVVLGILVTFLTGTGALLNRSGSVMIGLGIYDLLSGRVNKWIGTMVSIMVVLVYDYALRLLAGDLPR